MQVFKNNIDKFDYYSGVILAFLLNEFPIEKDIHVLKDIINDSDANDSDIYFVFKCVQALSDFGFLSFKEASVSTDSFVGVRLSLKALQLLKAMPKSLNANKSLGEKLKDSVILGEKEAIKQSVNLAFSLVSKVIG